VPDISIAALISIAPRRVSFVFMILSPGVFDANQFIGPNSAKPCTKSGKLAVPPSV
jgi:hypothetical protein